MIKLKKGIKVICPNCSDIIATTNIDILMGSVVSTKTFDFARGQQCVANDLAICKKCKAPYIKGGNIHTINGWV